jgi:hypothetical protein
LTAVLTGVVVTGGLVAVTQVSHAESNDLYQSYDAIAIAKRIPNDQGSDPDCGHGRTAGREAGSTSGDHHGAGKPGAAAAAPSAPALCDKDLGPFAADFVDIRSVSPNVTAARQGSRASRGSFSVRCGRNEQGFHNSDNVIVAPGVVNGAHHVHDYVGNDSTSGASTDQSLAAAGTTCDKGDLSTYYWPVLRDLGRTGPDAADPTGGGGEGNRGAILTASSVRIEYQGNPRSKVVPMPRFLRILTGDAKAVTNGPANANAKWSCTGFADRVTTRYPLCPQGSQVLRISDFPNCWDGANTDSANHRSHVVFPLPDGSGRCPKNTVAVPQLKITLAYDVPPGRSFAVDGFAAQMHNPITDHNDFINVMPDRLMATAAACINSGRRC